MPFVRNRMPRPGNIARKERKREPKTQQGDEMSPNEKIKKVFTKPHHITIVVKDLEKTQKFYESIGIGPWQDYGSLQEYTQLNVPDREGFYNLKFKFVQIGHLQIQLAEPGEGRSVYKDHLEQKGEGVFHIGFEVEDIKDVDKNIEALGLEVLQSGRRDDGTGFSYFQTAEKAGVTLLVRQSPSPK